MMRSMASLKNQKKTARRRFSAEFNTGSLGLAEQVAVVGAANRLGLHESRLYAWRKKVCYEAGRSETDKELAIENARLKQQMVKKDDELAILKKAAAYFTKSLK